MRITPTIRLVDRELGKNRPPSERPVIASLGTLQEVIQASPEGTELSDPEGVEVTDGCTRDPLAAYTELLTTITADKGGGWIEQIEITYTSGGTTYVLPVSWNYVVCGAEVRDPMAC